MLVLVGFQLYRFMYQSDYFQLQQVDLSGATDEVREEALALGGLKTDDPVNLIQIQPSRMADRIQDHPKIKSASVQKIYPNQLKIVVEERQPVAIVASRELYLIDADRIVLAQLVPGELAEYKLPFISGIQTAEITLGSEIDKPGLNDVLETIAYLSDVDAEFAGQFSEFALNENREIVALLLDGLEVRFGRHHPLAKMPELELFIKRHQDLRKFEYVDLRFSNQIVYLPKKN